MIDEELAEAYIDEHSPCFKEYPKAPRGALKQAFLAGLKAGRPVWHNLMNDQHDLPNDDRFVLNEAGVRVFYLPSRHKWYYVSPVKPVISEIVAWCEIPTYKEE